MDYLIMWGLMGAIGYGIASSKGRGQDGFALGVLLGPIGWFIVLFLADSRNKCRHCGGIVENGFPKCKHCGSDQ